MWVDTNGCLTDTPDCGWCIGTVAKGVEPSVEAAILAAAERHVQGWRLHRHAEEQRHRGSSYGGIKVPASLKATIATIKAGIIKGKISVNPNNVPRDVTERRHLTARQRTKARAIRTRAFVAELR